MEGGGGPFRAGGRSPEPLLEITGVLIGPARYHPADEGGGGGTPTRDWPYTGDAN